MNDDTAFNPVELATELTIAWLSNPNTRANADEVPSFLAKMHQAVNDLATPPAPVIEEATSDYAPAVSVKKSLASKDHIISMIDGKPYKTLKRHLSGHGLTPAQYRERYNLKADYPMVSETYSAARRAMAHKIGLGQKGRTARATAPKAAAPAKPARAPRKTKTA
ncbi:MAG: MucR family transcriptional regulator [Sphingomonas sp.]|jgi:predicted transcriptional regulator|uniref:MucR family transcriptional regulator n=1 Tax=Sphingomonas sp. TaxID=28214 RepID=UPI0035615830